jgi:CHAT domain-containing protein
MKNTYFFLVIFLGLSFSLSFNKVVGQELTTSPQQNSLDSAQKICDNLAITQGKYDTLYAKALYNLALLHKKFANYSESETMLYEAMESFTAKGSNQKAQRTLSFLNIKITLADLYFNMERYNEALDVYNESIVLSQFMLPEYHEKYIYQLFQHLITAQKIGLYTVVDKKMVEIEKIYKQHNLQNRIDFVAVVLKKAELMNEKRQYYESLDILDHTLAKLNKGGFKTMATYSTTFLSQKIRAAMGKTHATLKQYAKAEGFYRPITTEKIADENLYQEVFINLGMVLQNQKKYTEALTIFENNHKHVIKKYGEKSPQIAIALTYIADLYAFQDKFSKAEELYKQAIAILKNNHTDKAIEYAMVCFKLGSLYEEMFLYQSAVPMYAECLKMRAAELGEEHPDYLRTLNRLARVYQKLQLYEKAEPYFREYILALNNDIAKKFPALNDSEKASFYEGMKPNIENFMRYCVDRAGLNPYQPIPSFKQSSKILGDLYDLQLSTKAILLSASSKIRQQILSSGDTMLVNKYKQWNSCKEQLTQYSLIKRNDLLKIGVDIDSLNRATNELEKELSLLSTDFAQSYTTTNLPTWQDIQKKLQPDEAAIELIQIPYKKDTTFYVALIVKADTKNQPEVAFFQYGVEMDTKFLKFYRNAIRYQTPNKMSFEKYWQPIAEKLTNIRKVYLSPDGAFHQISLYTLLNPQTEKYLLEEIDITLLTNTKDLLTTHKKEYFDNKTALLIGRPSYFHQQSMVATTAQVQTRGAMREIMRGSAFSDLIGTEKEVRYIDSLLKSNTWNTKLCLGKDANENIIKKTDELWKHLSIESPTILHIATHGFFVNSYDELTDPMLRSGVVLAGINNYLKNGEKLQNEDGILNASEAMLLNLSNTELVILSACETGLGEVQQGEGVYGLQRALKMAGTKTLMMSLWKVDDLATTQLMSFFYAELMAGKTKTQAFHAAQLAVKEKYKNPLYWGAFVMIGE